MSWTEEATKYHERLAVAMRPHADETLSNEKITKILMKKYPELREKSDWILPSDHCINHTNKGACQCSMSEKAIFERVGVGKYLVR